MISGSYWPGDVSVFCGQGGGRFAAGEFLKDPEGNNANAGPPWASPRKPEMDSLAAAPWLVDWDGDGDLDLLVGNIAGRVVLLANEGDAKTPKFVRKGPISAGPTVLDVDHNDAGPTTADWDGDGRWDLIVGGGAGTVMFFRNTGTAQAPQFAAGVELVKGRGHGSATGEPTGPSSRVKPHVCDWNGDGALDLLVGDFCSRTGPEPMLTDKQRAQKDRLQGEMQKVSQELGKLYEKCDNEPDQLTGDDKKQYEAVRARLTAISNDLRPLEPERISGGNVWVYLQKRAVDAAAPKGGK